MEIYKDLNQLYVTEERIAEFQKAVESGTVFFNPESQPFVKLVFPNTNIGPTTLEFKISLDTGEIIGHPNKGAEIDDDFLLLLREESQKRR